MENELELIRKLYVNNGEYDFSNQRDANNFANDLYWNIQNTYSADGYHHKYKTIGEFIQSHHADSEAYWLYEDKYSN